MVTTTTDRVHDDPPEFYRWTAALPPMTTVRPPEGAVCSSSPATCPNEGRTIYLYVTRKPVGESYIACISCAVERGWLRLLDQAHDDECDCPTCIEEASWPPHATGQWCDCRTCDEEDV